MNVIDEISQIAARHIEWDIDVPTRAVVGSNKWQEIINILVDHRGPEPYGGFRNISCHHIGGVCDIVHNTDVHPDHVSLGRMTLTDIFVEDILLDDDTYNEIFIDICDSN